MPPPPPADEWVVVHAAEANNRALHGTMSAAAAACRMHLWCDDLPVLFGKTRPHHVVLHITCEIAEYLGRNKLLQAMHLMHTIGGLSAPQ